VVRGGPVNFREVVNGNVAWKKVGRMTGGTGVDRLGGSNYEKGSHKQKSGELWVGRGRCKREMMQKWAVFSIGNQLSRKQRQNKRNCLQDTRPGEKGQVTGAGVTRKCLGKGFMKGDPSAL